VVCCIVAALSGSICPVFELMNAGLLKLSRAVRQSSIACRSFCLMLCHIELLPDQPVTWPSITGGDSG